MALLPEWGMRNQGIVSGVIGLVLMLITVMIWRKMEGKYVPVYGICKDVNWHCNRYYRNCCTFDADSFVKRIT